MGINIEKKNGKIIIETNNDVDVQVKTKKRKVKQINYFFVIDRSGSMQNAQRQVISGFNEYVNAEKNKNKETDTTAKIWVTLFDNNFIPLYVEENLDVANLNTSNYRMGGSTALLDAVGNTLDKMENYLKGKKNQVSYFIVHTDGEENSSKFYNSEQIKKRVNELEKSGDAVFIFLGADINNWGDAIKIGMSSNVMSFAAQDTATGYSSLQSRTRGALKTYCSTASSLSDSFASTATTDKIIKSVDVTPL